ncbi:polysaccharide deacetylase family protein [Seinonella peptonophila]|nr:polysaccharide deacetylase family protein [Seinonella peptonophila]
MLNLGMCLLLIIGGGCSLFADTKSVDSSQQSVKAPKQKKPEKKQIQKPKVLIKPIVKQNVTITFEEQQELKKITMKEVIFRGSAKSKRVALTFDDGPDDKYTLKILEILRKEQVRATFFVMGKMVHNHPEILKRIDQEGHIIGNHTWSHPQLTHLSDAKVKKEVNSTTQEIQKQIGKRVNLVRPPYGAVNKSVIQEIKGNHYYVINWDVDTNDWRGRTGKQIEQTVKQTGKSGSIVLQHNAGKTLQGTVDALPAIIKELKSKGYELVTLDQLLSIPPYQGVQADVVLAPADQKVDKPVEQTTQHNKEKLQQKKVKSLEKQ